MYPDDEDIKSDMGQHLQFLNTVEFDADLITTITEYDSQEMLSYIYDHCCEAPTQWSDSYPRKLSPMSTKEEEPDYAQFIGPLGFVSLN